MVFQLREEKEASQRDRVRKFYTIYEGWNELRPMHHEEALVHSRLCVYTGSKRKEINKIVIQS